MLYATVLSTRASPGVSTGGQVPWIQALNSDLERKV